MRKKAFVYIILVTLVFVLSSISNLSLTNTSGPPAGYTGSSFDGKNCGISGCHSILAVSKTGWITSNVPGTGYIPLFTYTITAQVINPIRSKFGFEVSPHNNAGTLQGTLIVTNSTETKLNTAKYITQTAAGCGGSGSRTWTFNWKAPTVGTGAVTFHGAFNATNANGSSSGDSIYVSSLVIPEDPNISVNTLSFGNDLINVFPNPCSGRFTLDTHFNPGSPFLLKIYDALGNLLRQCEITSTSPLIDIFDFPVGIYYVGVTFNMETTVKKIVLLKSN